MWSSRRAASGFDDDLLRGVMCSRRPADALAHLLGRGCAGDAGGDRSAAPGASAATRRCRELDLVLTYGGGDPVVAAYRALRRARLRADLQRARSQHPSSGAARATASPAISPSSATACPTARRASRSSSCDPAAQLAGAAVPARRHRLGRQADARQRRRSRPCLHRATTTPSTHRRAPCSTSAATSMADDRLFARHPACSRRPAPAPA